MSKGKEKTKEALSKEFSEFLNKLAEKDNKTTVDLENLLIYIQEQLEYRKSKSSDEKSQNLKPSKKVSPISQFMESVADLPIVTDEISRFMQSKSNAGDISYEVNQFLDSLDRSLSASSDDALYESFVFARNKLEEKSDKINIPESTHKGKGMSFVEMREKEAAKIVEKKSYFGFKKNRDKNSFGFPHIRRFKVLSEYVVFFLASLILGSSGYWVWKWMSDSDKRASAVTIPVAKTNAIPVKAEENLKKSGNTSQREPPILNNVESNKKDTKQSPEISNQEDIYKKLWDAYSQMRLTEQDVHELQEVYQKHSNSPSICRLIFLSMVTIGNENALKWLENVLCLPQTDRVLLTEAMLETPNNKEKSQKIAERCLQIETSSENCIKIIALLSKNEYYNTTEIFISKFYSNPQNDVRESILSAMASQKSTSPKFFITITASEQYDILLRIKAIEAFIAYLHINPHWERNDDLLLELSQIAIKSDNIVFQQKLQEAIKFLIEKNE